MFSIDDKDIRRFEKDLKAFKHRAYPFATKNTVNTAAFMTQRIYRTKADTRMVLRNRFTKQSIQVDQARTLNVSRQAAVVGSTADYMEDQEFGAVKIKKGSKGVSIPTSYAAGQEGQQPRMRMPRKRNKLANIKLKHRRKRGKSRKQRNAAAIHEAAGSSSKFIFLDLGKTEGIFKVIGGKRRPKIKMVHDLSRKSVVIPRNPMLKPSVDTTTPVIPIMYKRALVFQLKRHRLFLP